jgi:drebrin-like protein
MCNLCTNLPFFSPYPLDGDLSELLEDFNEGRIQFAFVKVTDPNSGLPKYALIAWCGGGVPERTKGYFTSHLAVVSKILHGYHVQITARSDSDLSPESIVQKVADASGAKYSAASSTMPTFKPPPVASKPVFTPTALAAVGSVNPIVAARNRSHGNIDDDGWGADAPPVTRTQLEKVESAYKPTKVNISELVNQKQEPSRFSGGGRQESAPSDVIGGGYQPVGKVDIAAIRAAAKHAQDDRPTLVKGAYEPVGKVDIAAIRAKAQKPTEDREVEPPSRSLADRSAAFTDTERMTSLPKPKVAKKFGGAAFAGTKAPTPGGVGFSGTPTTVAPSPIGSAGRSFADSAGKTPAQLWAEKKAREGSGLGAGNTVSPPITSPVTAQKSGSEWRSGYTGKSWNVQAPAYSRGGLSQQNTGDEDSHPGQEPSSPGGGVSALRDRFKDASLITPGAPPIPRDVPDEPSPPPPPNMSSRPSGGFALPGMTGRPAAPEEDEEEDDPYQREPSPIRVAQPVARVPEPKVEPPEDRLPPRPIPARDNDDDDDRRQHISRAALGTASAVAAVGVVGAGATAAAHSQQAPPSPPAAPAGGKRAIIQYDYEKAEDNEIDLVEGDEVTNIEMVDDDWWMGTNSRGESGLFPSNYVELVEDGGAAGLASRPVPPPQPEPEPVADPEPSASAGGGATATAQFDYEAAEDNGKTMLPLYHILYHSLRS